MATLTIRDVRKSYGALEVLKGINLEAADGEFVALVGPSGCGKSTLLAMIAGLESISHGEIRIGGLHASTGGAVPRRHIGIVPDNRMDNALFPELKVRSNVSVASAWKTRLGHHMPLLSARREREQVARAAAKVQVATAALGRAVS